MKDTLKIVYSAIDEEISCIHVLRRCGRGYKLINDINENATELYNSLIGGKKSKNNSRIKRIQKQKEFIEELKKGCIFDLANRVEETDEYIIAYTDFGKKIYSKKKLAKFWLTNSNDVFFKTFGFNWVPDYKLQELVRKELNHERNNFHHSIAFGVDFGSYEVPIPQNVMKSIVNSIDINDILKHSSIHKGMFK